MFKQNLQDFQFVLRQVCLLPIGRNGAVSRIQNYAVMFQKTAVLSECVGAPKHSLHLGSQHIQVKGLGNKIICATAHGHNHIHVVCR